MMSFLLYLGGIITWIGILGVIISIAIILGALSGRPFDMETLLVPLGTVLAFVLRTFLLKAVKKIQAKPIAQEVIDKVRNEIYSDSLAGKYTCAIRESNNKVNEAHCYVYGTSLQGIHVDVTDGGLHFGPALYYRGIVSAAVAGGMQSAHPMSLLMTAAGTHTIEMHIPWNDITGCQRAVIPGNTTKYEKVDFDSSRFFGLSFYNREKDRNEWIGFFVLNTEGKELESFTTRMQEHGITFTEFKMAEDAPVSETVSADAKS